MRQDTLRELTKLMFDNSSKACVSDEANYVRVEQALESELIQFVQLSRRMSHCNSL